MTTTTTAAGTTTEDFDSRRITRVGGTDPDHRVGGCRG